jgi:hypothetical protein
MSVYEIHPPIGIARVGNAPDAYTIGPETYRGLPILPDAPERPFRPADFRDAEGRLRRQAARFRILKRDAKGVREVTLGDPEIREIRWTVHLANKKASWYAFQTSQGEAGYPSNHPLRNADKTTAAERRALIIDAGPRSISGKNAGGVEFSRTTIPPGYKGGTFPPAGTKPDSIDTLGSLKTDGDGRLVVLGGHGHSGSNVDPPALPTYANNDGWWDDTSDGSVTATIVLATGEQVQASPAWVLVAPPKFAPEIANLVTLYDTIFDVAVRYQGREPAIYKNGMWNRGPGGFRPSFATDIRPILERGMTYPWVAAIPPKAHSFDLGRLADPSESMNGFRRYYLGALRAPGDENVIVGGSNGVTMMPYLAGDDALGAATASTSGRATSKYLRLTDTQYFFLQQWADGIFDPGPRPDRDVAERLTRAVLENCVGGAFSPGIEMTWISRNPAFYAEPFRLKARTPVPDPLSLDLDLERGLEPGDVSRYMALPWQADFNECSSQPVEGRVLWWWPAQRPEFVYLREPVGGANVGAVPGARQQVPWVGTDYDQNGPDYISFADNVEMVENWWKLGFVFNVGSDEDPDFVEVERRLPRP